MVKKLFLLSILLVIATTRVSASAATGVSYLRSQQGADGTIGGPGVTGWAVMALAMAGQKNQEAIDALKPIQRSLSSRPATDVERQILALAAAGEDPRTFESVDAISSLQGRVSGGQIGATDYVNDDIFGVLAFRAARTNIPGGVINTIISSQQSDGGWGITKSGSTSTDMTALALIAVDGSLSGESRDKAINYLKSKQNDDGGFATSSGASNLGSAMWVDWMIMSKGLNRDEWSKNGKSSRDYIANHQLSNGSWENSPLMTSYGVMALSGRAFPYVGVTVTPTPRPTPTVTPTTRVTATPRPTATPTGHVSTPSPTPTLSQSGQPTPSTPMGTSAPQSASSSPATTASPLNAVNASREKAATLSTPVPISSSVPLLSKQGVEQIAAAVNAPAQGVGTPKQTIQFHLPYGWVAFGLIGLNLGSTGLHVIRHKKRSG